MKQIRIILGVGIGLLFWQKAQALAIVNDEIANYATGNLGANGTGGTGTVPGWFNPH